jgi:hypothetical protein
MRKISAETFEKYDLPRSYEEEYRLKDTMTCKTVPAIKDPVHIFTNDTGGEVWINERLFAYFKDMTSIRLYQKDSVKNAIAVYVADYLVGVLLPINHN